MTDQPDPPLQIFQPGRGRPPRAEAPSAPLAIRLSPAERMALQIAAEANHQSVSEFVRDAVVTAASDCLDGSPPGRS